MVLAGYVYGAGEADDVPVVTIVSPEALSTIEEREGYFTPSASAVIPSGDLDSEIVNFTLFENITDNINYTRFVNDSDEFFNDLLVPWGENQTSDRTGVGNTSEFASALNLPDDYYINWYVMVCNENNNCSNSSMNSAVMNRDYDTTAGSVGITYPADNALVKDSPAYINFTATNGVYVQNVTLFFNYSSQDLEGADFNYTDLESNITYIENETLTNTGDVAPFEENTGNITLVGNFTDWGTSAEDGFYIGYVMTCDYVGNCVNSSKISFELDTTEPYISDAIVNASVSNTCDTVGLTFNASEPVSITVNWGLVTDALNETASISGYANDTNEINMTGLLSNTVYYYNLTICDEANNCNYTATGTGTTSESFLKEHSACDGWNAYGILNTSVKLQDIRYGLNDDNALTISWFNRTSQTFLNYVTSLHTNENHTIPRGDAVLTNVNGSTFVKFSTFMETSNTTINDIYVYTLNNTNGNWTNIGVLQDWQMGNITQATELLGNITYLSYFDNSQHRYVDHIYTWQWNNETLLEAGDSLWMWGDQNLGKWWRNETYNATFYDAPATEYLDLYV